MIKIAGSVRRSFIFPADLEDAFDYYTDLEEIFSFLPYISLKQRYSANCYRMEYRTVELGTYKMTIVTDIQADTSSENHRLLICPFSGAKPVKPKSRMNSSYTQGFFYIESKFTAAGHQTRIEFQIRLEAELPTPMGLRFMPRTVVDRITANMTERRTREIVEGFIENSINAYLDEFEDEEMQNLWE